jgi:hypothetical protein
MKGDQSLPVRQNTKKCEGGVQRQKQTHCANDWTREESVSSRDHRNAQTQLSARPIMPQEATRGHSDNQCGLAFSVPFAFDWAIAGQPCWFSDLRHAYRQSSS